MKKTKIYRVVGKRTELYEDDFEATSKADAIRQFKERISEGADWYDVGRLSVRAQEKGE